MRIVRPFTWVSFECRGAPVWVDLAKVAMVVPPEEPGCGATLVFDCGLRQSVTENVPAVVDRITGTY